MNKHSRALRPVTALALLLAGACAPKAFASGFQLREQSASAQGTAFAGVAAGGADISNMFFNPAVLTGFQGFQLVAGGTSVSPKTELHDAVGRRGAYPASMVPLAGPGLSTIAGPGSTGNAAHGAVLPELYAMWSVSPDFKLGLSLNAPFGMITEYDHTFEGRYHALRSDLKTVDIALSAAYRIHPKLSVGASILRRSVDAELSQAVDYGQITYLGVLSKITASTPPAAIPTILAAAAPFKPGTAGAPNYDGKATVRGSKNVIGYKLGLTYEPMATFHAGLAYQSATVVKMDANIKYEAPTSSNPALQGTLTSVINQAHLVDGTAFTEVHLPDTTSLGLSWDVTPTVNLAFEADRTGWSKFQELNFSFGSGQANSTTLEKWHNTMFYSLGGSWKASEALTLRAGLAKDQSAVDTQYRTPRIPDSARVWMSVGAGYAFSKSFGLDFAYTHIAVKDGELALSAGTVPTASDFTRGNLTGTYKSSIDIVALQARFSF